MSNTTAFEQLMILIRSGGTGERILAKHVDTGRGRCAAAECGAGSRDWPCDVHKLATHALRGHRLAS